MTSLWGRITAHATREPGRIALVGEETVTYAELVERVGRTARRLADTCGAGDIVAVHSPTSVGGLVALLAVRAVGAAFHPMDINAPAARQDYVLRDAGVRTVLRHDLSAPGEIRLEDGPQGAPRGTRVPPGAAYLIYTSGSTGRPKGVVVPESALLNTFDALSAMTGFGPDSSVLSLTALSFDIAQTELLLPLTAGARVVMPPPNTRQDPALFTEAVRRHRPGVIQATPSFYRVMLAAGWEGAPDAMLWCGGEAMTEQLAGELLPRCRELWNLYGPTEATVYATGGRVRPGEPVGLGQPLANTSMCLVDDDGMVVEGPGADGELVLSGAGIALGYLGEGVDQSAFTAPASVKEPAYRTGDRGRYRADGSLEYLGRKDSQVKLRGHRIELGEIESVLEEHPAVHQAVVLLCDQDDADRAHLTAVVSAHGAVEARELRGWLLERLPRTMLPKRVKVRATLPHTTAGKVDRVALREEYSR